MTEKFHWTSPAGVEIVLPHMNKVKAGVLRRVRSLEPIDQMFSVLEEVADKDTLAKVDELDADHLNDLFEQWQKDAASVGESSGSSI